MYVIKQSTGKRFLVKEEDNDFVTINLVYDKSAATRFSSHEEASTVRREILENAEEQLEKTKDPVERESLSEFLSLVVTKEH